MGASVGIRPKADGENIVLTDTHRDLVDDVTATTDEFGTVLGEGINEIAATAQSANDSAGELASKVSELERVKPKAWTFAPASGSGWVTLKSGSLTYLDVLPGVWRITATVVGADGLRLYKRNQSGNVWVADVPTPGTASIRKSASFTGVVNVVPGDRFFFQALNPDDVEAILAYQPI